MVSIGAVTKELVTVRVVAAEAVGVVAIMVTVVIARHTRVVFSQSGVLAVVKEVEEILELVVEEVVEVVVVVVVVEVVEEVVVFRVSTEHLTLKIQETFKFLRQTISVRFGQK